MRKKVRLTFSFFNYFPRFTTVSYRKFSIFSSFWTLTKEMDSDENQFLGFIVDGDNGIWIGTCFMEDK